MNKVKEYKVYSTTVCVYCKLLKDWLDRHEVSYQEINLSTDPSLGQEMIQKTGQMGVPVSIITLADKTEEIVVGFDQERLGRILGIAS
ncbi:NrdH-redoxin [Patescibacteria group bacterium]|nr:NrdH-redoxin [Patescibacteria group bacterium]